MGSSQRLSGSALNFETEKLIPDLYELVKRYEPDDLLVDGEWEQPSSFWETKPFLAWLFTNSSVKDTIVVDDRWGNECRGAHGLFKSQSGGC